MLCGDVWPCHGERVCHVQQEYLYGCSKLQTCQQNMDTNCGLCWTHSGLTPNTYKYWLCWPKQDVTTPSCADHRNALQVYNTALALTNLSRRSTLTELQQQPVITVLTRHQAVFLTHLMALSTSESEALTRACMG